MPIERLLEDLHLAIREAHEVSVVELASRLLRVCRACRRELLRELEDYSLEPGFLALRGAAAALFRELAKVRFDALGPAELGHVVAWLEGALGASTPGLVARAAALGLDAAFGHRFALAFRGRAVLLADGDPFPIAPPPVRLPGAGTDPDRLEHAVDRLPRLGLAPEGPGVDVVLSSVHEDLLAPLGLEPLQVGAAVPNTPLDDLDVDQDPDSGTFYAVRLKPDRRPEHVSRVRRLLARVRELSPAVVVLPELTVDGPLLDEVRTTLAAWAPRERPFVLVAGSRHLDVDAGRAGANEATVIFRSLAEATHRKVRPYEKEGLGRERLDLARPTITLHRGGAWNLVVLICKDLLDRRLVELLIDLQARLTLVPSLSPVTTDYDTNAGYLGLHGRSVVVVANVHHGAHAHEAVFARPRRPPVVAVRGPGGPDGAPPSPRVYVLGPDASDATAYEA